MRRTEQTTGKVVIQYKSSSILEFLLKIHAVRYQLARKQATAWTIVPKNLVAVKGLQVAMAFA
jgi:hypothetical protein